MLKMKLIPTSLTIRLLVLILIPLVVVASAAIYWRINEARKTAEDIFDRQLIVLCLAISRDVASSGGDTLSATTQKLFEQAAAVHFLSCIWSRWEFCDRLFLATRPK